MNPAHLEPKTPAEHARSHKTKMTPDKARLIRESKGSQRAIAREFGISQSLVWKIKHRLVYYSD